MLWTIVPTDALIEEDDDTVEVAEMSIGSATVVLHVGADGTRRVERLLSTNPADYLRPQWQPGTVWPGSGTGAGAQGTAAGKPQTDRPLT